ncbi:VanZ family protein [Pseudolysinimonas sp.]|jgi:glycopeptide antibiotics resistance protein|uniref:VanZ family protein n=1 Tax=Pseudolysinimonas sp. TaxID=2680009 RepID=UPI003783437E
MTRRSIPFAVLAAAYLVLVGVITLGPTLWRTRPTQGDYDVLSLSTWLDPDTWSRVTSPEFVANILLFVPLGLLLRLAVPRLGWFGAAVLGAGVSVVIEVLQVWTPRVSDPRDLVANGLGALAGALIGAALARVGRVVHRPVHARDAVGGRVS